MGMEEVKIGSVVQVQVEEGHDLFIYQLKITSIAEEYKSDDGLYCCVAYGEGVTEHDKELAEEFTSRIDEQTFVKVI